MEKGHVGLMAKKLKRWWVLLGLKVYEIGYHIRDKMTATVLRFARWLHDRSDRIILRLELYRYRRGMDEYDYAEYDPDSRYNYDRGR
jgi:hypothetical protein